VVTARVAKPGAVPGSRLFTPKAFGGCRLIELLRYEAAPLQHPYRLRGCNSDLAQYSNTPKFQYSNTPSLRAAGFEDEDENEA
jgi:hypothetical protein